MSTLNVRVRPPRVTARTGWISKICASSMESKPGCSNRHRKKPATEIGWPTAAWNAVSQAFAFCNSQVMWGWSGRAPRQKCRSPSASMLYRPPRAPSDTCRRPVVGSRATTCFLKRVPETVTSWRAASTEALGTVIVLVGPERTENALTRGRVPRRWARWFIAQVLTPFEFCR